MGTNINIDIDDGDFQERMNESRIFVPRTLGDTIEDILITAINTAGEYPPETAGNQPPPPYYQRGVGMIGRGGNPTRGKASEDLKNQWTFSVDVSETEAEGVVINNASYSARVQDELLQTTFHARHDWPTMQDILRGLIGEAARGVDVKVTREKTDNLLERIADFYNR